jgi:hypothetical protein
MNRAALLSLALVASACSDEPHYLVVTVVAPPAVHDADVLRVTLEIAGSERIETLDLDDRELPVTFSLTAPGREGDVAISIDALDSDELRVGHGAATTALDADAVQVDLDTVDFVVNTELAMDQYPDDDFEAHGFQVASGTDGRWTVTYRDSCTGGMCNLYARRFDSDGRAVTTGAAAGTNGFTINSTPTIDVAHPAVATSGDRTVALWDFRDVAPGTAEGIACRAIDAGGNLGGMQRSVATDLGSDVVAVTPLANQNFAAVWTATPTAASQIRAAIVRPDCTTLSPAVTVSQVDNGRRAAVAATVSGEVMYAWRLDGGIRVRIAGNNGAFTTPDSVFLPAGTMNAEYVRIAPLPTGFAVFVRLTSATEETGPGRIDLYRTDSAGGVIGTAQTVTTRTGNDFESSQGFGVASRSDGTMFVTWHSCDDGTGGNRGDGNGCGVFGRAYSASGSPLTDELVVPTTINADQTNPSVAAVGPDAFAVVWRDQSMQPPDSSGSAVRARIIYVPGGE